MCLLSVHTNREMQAWADKVAVAVVAFLYVLGAEKTMGTVNSFAQISSDILAEV